MTHIEFLAVSPLASVQDEGRFGALGYGVAASGPMDRGAFGRAGQLLNSAKRGAGSSALECATGRTKFSVKGGTVLAAFCGGEFELLINQKSAAWENVHKLNDGDSVEIIPGRWGNYAIVRFDQHLVLPSVLGSQSTNMIAQLGGFKGRMILPGDRIEFENAATQSCEKHPNNAHSDLGVEDQIRIIWGLHADLFSTEIRTRFLAGAFEISAALDRMGVRLKDAANIFSAQQKLSLVSDAIVPGDIQILGDGTAIILMRDHQPTGGYPRIATIISADLDRFAQLRPGSEVRFGSVSVDHAHAILKQGS